MEKDRGYEFLFGDNKKSGSFQCEDGSEGYIYSDGSGYFHGADGSDGYIYSDGSGYFHGSDGSDGYKYSDGSGYFRGGSNDVDAYQYSDGSGYYGDAKHTRENYWPVEKTNDDSSEVVSSYSTSDNSDSDIGLGGILLGFGLLALLARSKTQDESEIERWVDPEKEREERERQEARRRKRVAFCKKHRKGILITTVCFILAIILSIGIWQLRKMIPVQHDVEDLIGKDYEDVVHLLTEAGFTKIHTEYTEDLDYENLDKEDQVYQIYIFGKNTFSSSTKYPYDTRITIKYHVAKMIQVPISSKDAKEGYYVDVISEFEKAGFHNIQTVIEYDIVTGWLTDDGEVKSVTINGDKRFSEETEYRPDAEIIVTYHTLKKNKPTE